MLRGFEGSPCECRLFSSMANRLSVVMSWSMSQNCKNADVWILKQLSWQPLTMLRRFKVVFGAEKEYPSSLLGALGRVWASHGASLAGLGQLQRPPEVILRAPCQLWNDSKRSRWRSGPVPEVNFDRRPERNHYSQMS